MQEIIEVKGYKCPVDGKVWDSAKDAETCYLSHLTPTQSLATRLHSSCASNHTDACDWYYGTWVKPPYAKTKYLQKAELLEDYAAMNALNVDELLTLFQKVR